MNTENEITCRGCYALGTACQRCSKCRKVMSEFMAWKNKAPALTTADVEKAARRIFWEVCTDGYLENAGLTENMKAITKILTESLPASPSPQVDRAVLETLYNAVAQYQCLIGWKDIPEAMKAAETHLANTREGR